MADSISRQFARWAVGLRYEDLPPQVVDKVKALLFQHLVSAVFGAQTAAGKEAIHLARIEDGKPEGATIIWDGSTATRTGAAFVNADLMHTAGMFDSYRMITHPGPMLIPPALACAELEHYGGRELITALAVGYEVMTRLANDFVPSTGARGFRPSPIFGTVGSAVVSGKLLDLTEEQMVAAIAFGATFASGTNEGPRTGGGETLIHDPHAASTGVFSAVMAREGVKGAEAAIEGRAGFLNAFTGDHTGRLSYNFTGPMQIDLATITAGLGSRWEMLTVMFRMYATGGFNQPVIDLMAELKQQHRLDADDIEAIEVTMNYLETLYPTPAFPRPEMHDPGVGSTHYFTAHVAVNGGYPQVGGRTYGPMGDHPEQDQRVLAFMPHVTVIGEYGRPMFSPRIVVRRKGGATVGGEYPYARMAWNFDQLLERMQDPAANYPLGQAGYDALLATVRSTERLATMAPLYHHTAHPAPSA